MILSKKYREYKTQTEKTTNQRKGDRQTDIEKLRR